MAFKDRFTNWLNKGTSLSSGAIAWVSGSMTALWSKANTRVFIDEGYRKNVIAYRCISLVSRAAARVPLVVYKGSPENRGKKIADHWMLDLLNNPNPMTDKASLIESILSYEQIGGNAYLHAISVDNDTRLSELWVLPTQDMSIKAGKRAIPFGYELQVSGKQVFFPIEEDGSSEIVHFRYFNPDNPFLGMSPMEPALTSVDQHNQSGEFNQSLLQNGATPTGAMIYAPSEGTKSLTNDQFKRLKTEMAENMQGTKNSGKPLLLDGGMRWEKMGLSPVTDLGMIEMKNQNSIEIAMCYSVPPVMVGILDASTYDNYAAAKLDLYEQAVLPNLGGVCRTLTKYGKQFGDNQDWFLWYDEDAIEALEPRRAITFDRAIKGIAGGLLSPNEGREMIGKDGVTGGDDVLISSSLIPLGFEVDTDEGE